MAARASASFMAPALAIGVFYCAMVDAAEQLALALAVGRIGWTSGGSLVSQQAPPDGWTADEASDSSTTVGGGLASAKMGEPSELLEDPAPLDGGALAAAPPPLDDGVAVEPLLALAPTTSTRDVPDCARPWRR